MITIALSKGRILKQTLPLLINAKIAPKQSPDDSRSLIIDSENPNVRFIIVRSSDAPTYVRLGAADIGIVGKDTLMEMEGAGVMEIDDLKIAQCRLCLATKKDYQPHAKNGRIKVATKYVNVARQYFSSIGQQVDLIKLYGSMELAPLVDLSDMILDLVDSGQTLKANGLVETTTIAHISSRLVVNKTAFKMKQQELHPLISALKSGIK